VRRKGYLWSIRALVSASVVLGSTLACEAQSLRWLGTLGGNSSEARDVSADGSVVVGWSYAQSSNYPHPFRWTAQTGMQDISRTGIRDGMAFGVSADGSVVVGRMDMGGYSRAFRWTPTDGMQDIDGRRLGYSSHAFDVSADGSVVVGEVYSGWFWRAFRWTAANWMQALGTLGGSDSRAYGVSADGSAVVGSAQVSPSGVRAFRWTAETGMQNLGAPEGASSAAYSVSAGGSVVVGSIIYSFSQAHAFRWTAEEGMQNLGTLPGCNVTQAQAVNADGSVVVGIAMGRGSCAFRWTAARGMENLNATYADLLAGGSLLEAAYAISPDGRYIVGGGYNAATRRREAFLLDTGFPPRGDVNRSGCVDDADLLAVLFAFGARGYRNEDIDWNGTVDDADLLQVLFHFGDGCEN
jgi:probable HAF family extracellular repeat protein